VTEVGDGAPGNGRSHGLVVLGLLLAVAGLAWLLAVAGLLDLPVTAWLGALLVVVGIAIAALSPGSHVGVLVAAGIVLALLGAAAIAVDVSLGAGVGDRSERPLAAADAEEGYELGVGTLRLDLTALPDAPRAPLRAEVGIGELVVTVPAEAVVVAEARVTVGDVQIRGRQRGGFDVDLSVRDEGVGDGPELRLELRAGIGSIRVVDG
jgi:hypothetical protein